jgi:signal transduction histidine kinase
LTSTQEDGEDIVASELADAARPRVARAPPSLWIVLGVAAAGLAAPVYTAELTLAGDDISGVHVALLHWISVPYVLVGLIAWWRRPESRLGPLMSAAGIAMGLSTLQFATPDLLFTTGAVFDLVPAALFLHLCLAFPDGRLRSRVERDVVVAAYAAAVGLQLAKMALGEFGPANLLAGWTHPDASAAVQQVQLVSLSTTLAFGACVLAIRRQHEGRSRRRSLGLLLASFALGLVLCAALFVVGAFDVFDSAFRPLQRVTLAAIGLAPFAFLIGLLEARLAGSAVGRLLIDLRTDLAPAHLRASLAEALRDPTLTLAYWLPDFQRFVDLDGRPVDVPDGNGRATTTIERDGEPFAALLHDHGLADERDLLAGVTAAAAIALDNARLHAELNARVEELRGSRARVIEAAQRERQRLERDLHDGAQQRLIALSLELSLLEKRLGDDPDAQTRVDLARREVALSLAELRDVAHGIHPAVLSGHGLEVALQSVVARAPFPVHLAVELKGRLREPLEVAAYYVVSESLANTAKHAHASSATVAVGRGRDHVVVEVVDDGIGGADTEGGTGLRGLADRVEALGGRLRVWTPTGGGTRVRAEIPCA